MTLGWRTAFSGDISDPFLQAGTMHMFAIDGLRIALCSGILIALMRVLQISRAWCGAITIPLIWFYTAATGWESLRPPRVAHDDHRARRLGLETARGFAEFPRPCRLRHFGLRTAPVI